jgi:hypothetical protein
MGHPVIHVRPFGCMLIWVLYLSVAPSVRSQTSTDLPQGQLGTPYHITVSTEGGLPPLAWHLASGQMPSGLQLSARGEIEGTPTTASQDPFTFTLSVSDSSNPTQSASMQFSVLIKVVPLRITGVSQEDTTLKIVGASADPPGSQANTTPSAPPVTGGIKGAKAPVTNASDAVNQQLTSQPAQNPCASVKNLPAIFEPLVSGQTTLSGCVENGTSAAQIAVIDSGATVQCSSTDQSQFVQRPVPFQVIQAVNNSFSQFAAQLSTPLTTGQQVCLTEIDSNGKSGKTMTTANIVKPASTSTAIPSCDSTTTAYFPIPPPVGRKVVSGCAGKAAGARVLVFDKNDALGSCPANLLTPFKIPPQDNEPANVNPQTGVFAAELEHALTDGELVCPYSVAADLNPPAVANKWGYDDPDIPLGRTHYYVSTGVEFSEDNQQFSSQDLYLALSLDRNWIRGNPSSSFTGLFNSEFSAQLTSIPVAASSTTSTSTTSTSPTPSLTTFISSRKAAVVSGALYAPLYADAFKGWFGSQTTAFFAPIVEGGLQTITSGALTASAPAPGTTTTTTTVNSQGLYYFWGAGLRLGDLKLHRSWNVAPEVLSHLDLTVGQWENFKQCRNPSQCSPGSDGAVPASQLYQPLLFALEGQLNVPKTPVQIGFQSITPLHGGGQGDLRFIFGVKLDVGCIYKAFKGGSTPSLLQCSDDQSSENASTASSNGISSANTRSTGTAPPSKNP